MARSRTLPLIRTSWLINVILFLLYPIYSIPLNLSIHPNPTIVRLLQPQLPSHSGRYGQCTFSAWPALTALVLSTWAWPDRTEPRRDIIYHPVFRPKCTTPHYTRSVSLPIALAITTHHWSTNINTKHIVSQNISLTNTYKHKTYCPSEHTTCREHISTPHIALQEYYLLLNYQLSYLTSHIKVVDVSISFHINVNKCGRYNKWFTLKYSIIILDSFQQRSIK